MTTISAKTILRSRNTSAPEKVLSTLLLRYPRFIHAEFMTHRTMSRNAASSRAIPTKKIIDDILADTAMPLHWGKNQKGMQADEECAETVKFVFNDGEYSLPREAAWLKARAQAVVIARAFDKAGYHKQVVNRLLEPFMHITVLVSATEWDNFLALRDHPDAEPHIQILAREIRGCLENDPVQDLEPDAWHLPFVTEEDRYGLEDTKGSINALQALSVACCASTSYKTVDGFDMTMERATEIFRKLINSRPMHASPLEHVAQADRAWKVGRDSRITQWKYPDQHANFIGFRQLRHSLEA